MVKELRQQAASQGRIFHAGKVNVTPASRQQCSGLHQTPSLIFWYAAVTFQWARHSHGESGPYQYTHPSHSPNCISIN